MDNNIKKSILKKYRKEIWSKFIKAIKLYELIKPGDKVAVCISGGKDSFLLAMCMKELCSHGQFHFDIEYIIMDPGYSASTMENIQNNLDLFNINAHIFKTNIFEVSTKLAENPCYLCARMRRGHLYNKAKELGCNKIALGHHMDDVIETVLMNLLFNGQYSGMMPKLHSDNFTGLELIRPLYLIKEEDIQKWKNYNNLEFINCACAVAEKNVGARVNIKNVISELKKVYSLADINILKSLSNVNLDTIIRYKTKGLEYNFLDNYEEK